MKSLPSFGVKAENIKTIFFYFRPRKLEVPGSDADGIYYLRNPDQANIIDENAKNKNVIIIGSSFIGECLFFKIPHLFYFLKK